MNGCFHGGAFWEEIGPRFDCLERRADVVNADVLDAWFPPAPAVIEVLTKAGEWMYRTSPPTHADGLRTEIARHRSLDTAHVLPGPGSSSLMYLALQNWLTPKSRVLLIEPSYGEYAHLCGNVIGGSADRMTLASESGFELNLDDWRSRLERGAYDLAVLVNPNNPTGCLVGRPVLSDSLHNLPAKTRVLIDEAYIDYAGGESMDRFAAGSRNVYVVKSMSKGYALSGLRVAYLAGPADELQALASRCPPWHVGLPAQLAAVAALGEQDYYRARYRETAALRGVLADGLRALGGDVRESPANWVLWRLPSSAPTAAEFIEAARRQSIHLRDAGATAPSLGPRVLRIAVKESAATNRVVTVCRSVLGRM